LLAIFQRFIFPSPKDKVSRLLVDAIPPCRTRTYLTIFHLGNLRPVSSDHE